MQPHGRLIKLGYGNDLAAAGLANRSVGFNKLLGNSSLAAVFGALQIA